MNMASGDEGADPGQQLPGRVRHDGLFQDGRRIRILARPHRRRSCREAATLRYTATGAYTQTYIHTYT